MAKKHRRRWKFCAYIFFGYVAGLVFVEIFGQLAIKYFEWRTPTGIFAENILNHSEPVLGFGLKKNLSQSMPGGWKVRTNSLGFRDDAELTSPKPTDEIRIFILGGSTVFGWAVDYRETIPGVLQKIIDNRLRRELASQSKTIRVINAGVPWYSSWHEAALVFFRILPLEPDWIIILDGLNDVATAINPTWAPIHLGFVDVPTRIAYEKRLAQGQSGKFWLEVLKLSPTFSYFHTKLKLRQQLDSGVYRPELWDQYLRYMEWLTTLTSSLGIRFSLFLQPVFCVDYSPKQPEILANTSGLRREAFANTFREVYLEGEKRLLSKKLLRFQTLKRSFDGVGDIIYLDGLHYSPAGNKILAETLFRQEIRPNLHGLLAR